MFPCTSPPEVERMDSKTGSVPVVVNFAAVVDNVVAAVYDAVVAAYAFWYSADNDGTETSAAQN